MGKVTLKPELLYPNLEKYLEICTDNIVEEAKAIAPVDTGALRDSIQKTKEEQFKYIIHDDVEYGIHQELGSYKMRAQPFLRPSLYNKLNYQNTNK